MFHCYCEIFLSGPVEVASFFQLHIKFFLLIVMLILDR